MGAHRLVIRRLGAHDSIPELTRLLHRAYASLAAMGLHYVATDQDDATTQKRAGEGECYVALWDGALAGTIVFCDAARTRGCAWYDRPDVSSIHQFAVDPAVQGQGIGDALLHHAESRAAETGAAHVALDTARPARHLIAKYERRGYCIVEDVKWGLPCNYESVIMSKAIVSDARS